MGNPGSEGQNGNQGNKNNGGVVDLVVLVTQEILDKKLVLVIINFLVDKVEMLVVETQAILEILAIKVMLRTRR